MNLHSLTLSFQKLQKIRQILFWWLLFLLNVQKPEIFTNHPDPSWTKACMLFELVIGLFWDTFYVYRAWTSMREVIMLFHCIICICWLFCKSRVKKKNRKNRVCNGAMLLKVEFLKRRVQSSNWKKLPHVIALVM